MGDRAARVPQRAGQAPLQRSCRERREIAQSNFCATYSFSNPCVPNFKVRLFSVTVRTVFSGTPDSTNGPKCFFAPFTRKRSQYDGNALASRLGLLYRNSLDAGWSAGFSACCRL
jgi:hypothetical protein